MAAKKTKVTEWGKPGALAVARMQVGGDLKAAALLYRLKRYFDPKKPIKRLQRHGKEWIAMSRTDWAMGAGLTEAEMKNGALPKLRKCSFVTIKQMKLKPNGPKLLWMSLDLEKLYESNDYPDMYHSVLNSTGIGMSKEPAYPYDKPANQKGETGKP